MRNEEIVEAMKTLEASFKQHLDGQLDKFASLLEKHTENIEARLAQLSPLQHHKCTSFATIGCLPAEQLLKGLFNEDGKLLGFSSSPIQVWKDGSCVEQSITDIWFAVCAMVKATFSKAKVAPTKVKGLGFADTCPLVVVDSDNSPVSVSWSDYSTSNVMVWMDPLGSGLTPTTVKEWCLVPSIHGVYKLSSYLIAITLVALPHLLVVAIIYSIPVYFLVGLCASWLSFPYFVLVIWVIVLMTNYYVPFLSFLAPNYLVGTSLLAVLLTAFFLFSGYFIFKDCLPKYWLLMHFFSMYKYALDALLINEYSCLETRCLMWFQENQECMVTKMDQ